MNLYVNLAEYKRAVAGSLSDRQDTIILTELEAASRQVDDFCDRHFYTEIATKYYPATWAGNGDPRVLRVDDIVSVTTLTVDTTGDGTYDTTLVEGTDYVLWPENRRSNQSYDRLYLLETGTQIYSWPCARRAIKVVGEFGFRGDTESVGTLGAAISDTTTTTVTMAAGHTVETGDTIIVGSEQMYVSGVNGDTLTVTRGVNGTTAATALIAASVSRRLFPAPVRQRVIMRTARLVKRSENNYGQVLTGTDVGVVSTFRQIDPEAEDFIRPYQRVVI